MDYLVLETVIDDLKDRLVDARVEKVFQPGRDRILFRLWTGQEKLRLVIDVSPGDGRLHLVEGNEPNPQRPPRFCQLLRARIRRIVGIELVPNERIVRIHLRGENQQPMHLMVEMLGVDGNMALVAEDGQIIDVLHRQTEAERPLRAGTRYTLPPKPERCHLSAVTAQAFDGCDPLASALCAQVEPMTPMLADAMAECARKEDLALVAKRAADEIASAQRTLCIGTYRNRPALSVLPLTHLLLKDPSCFDDLHAGLRQFYGEQTAISSVSPKDALVRSVKKALKRLHKRLQEIDRDEQKAEQTTAYQQYGELLLANLGNIKTGMECITLENWYVDPPVAVTIPLDPRKNPQDNAEQYFRRSKKFQRGQEHRERRRAETLQEIDWLHRVALSLDEAASSDELHQIREELEQGGLIPKPTSARSKAPLKTSGLKSATTPGGVKLIWGTNNRQNDLLLREVAKPDDLWFHAHDLPGSHLILQTGGQTIDATDCAYAAAVAAGYSRGKNDPFVEVKQARVRDLRRIKGGRPGFVLVDRFTTLRVAPLRP